MILDDFIPIDFKNQVEKELTEARQRAMETLILPVTQARVKSKTPRIWRQSNGVTCVSCGCLLAQRTPGCGTCAGRFYQRKYAERRRRERDLQS